MMDMKLGFDYLNKFYAMVPGYSSHFSAEVAAALLVFQNENDISGSIGEIGVMKGRSFIALALHAQATDLCLAIDKFSWPANVFQSFEQNCGKYGVDWERVVPVVANTQDLKPEDILSKAKGRPLRYLHIDGGHEPWILASDLELANQVMGAGGILCLDDMLHPQYPELPTVVHGFLAQHPEWVTFCIVDRADIFAAAKYMICKREFSERYARFLCDRFPNFVFPGQAEFSMSRGLILSKDAALKGYYERLIHS